MEPSQSQVNPRAQPHPTARALFDALDNGSSSRMKLNKNAVVAGWRNRYSQAEQYPVTMKLSGQTKNDMRHCSFSVKQVQRGEIEGTYGTGATVWPASMVLLKYLERHPSLFLQGQGKIKLVDLGAGTGITTIGAALLGASHCICTDGCSKVVQLAQENIAHAQEKLQSQIPSQTTETQPSSSSKTKIGNCEIDVQYYWWGDGSLGKRLFDIVLVSDCVLPKLYPIGPLVDGIDELLSDNGIAIISYEHRYFPEFNPKERFKELAALRNLQVDVIPQNQHDPVFSVDDIEIWHVSRRKE